MGHAFEGGYAEYMVADASYVQLLLHFEVIKIGWEVFSGDEILDAYSSGQRIVETD